MRNAIPPQPQSALIPNTAACNAASPGFACPLPLSSFAILAGNVALILAGAMIQAQTPANQSPAPAAAQTPKWPAFDKAAEASVVWDSHGLLISAANSSLEQILHEVSTVTGAKVEGLSTDQRVFGQYGPGRARDVLSELLQGSGYNVIMIGDQGQGSPRQILLSVRQAGSTQPSARPVSNNEEDDVEEPPANQEQVSPRPSFPQGAPPRTPQQFQQELRERQQQQGPPGQPQPQQPN